jgi:hypothetical protein
MIIPIVGLDGKASTTMRSISVIADRSTLAATGHRSGG